MSIPVLFGESAQEEILALQKDLKLPSLIKKIGSGKELTPAEIEQVKDALLYFNEFFSVSIPDTISNPVLALQQAGREVALSLFVRERGAFRLFLIVNNTVLVDEDVLKRAPWLEPFRGQEVQTYRTLTDDDGKPFMRQEDLIGWFCRHAHYARASAFGRFSAIKKLLGLGYSLEEIFKMMLMKPSAIRDALNIIADWENGEIINLSFDKAKRLVEVYAKEEEKEALLAEIDTLEEAGDQSQVDSFVSEKMKPFVKAAMDEVAAAQNAGDAVKLVAHDLFKQPDIEYYWDTESETIKIRVTQNVVDENGNESTLNIREVTLVPDTDDLVLPFEIRQDLIKRLPIKNRREVMKDE